MTRNELETALHQIGWKIEKSWNGLNDCIVNHKNEKTAFYVDENKIDIRASLFGAISGLGRGGIHFEMKEIELHIGGDMGKFEYVALHFNQSNFISFYNHSSLDKKK